MPAAWSTRTLVASALAAVVLGLGAGAAIGSAGGGDDGGRGGPGGFGGAGGPGGGPGTQRGQGFHSAQQPAAPGNATNG
ncbi:conserved exported hypothetical protein [Aeromicrobium sp. 9AM]|nr:conserved exported hypothetical protein [Aeromicrobium sp. 9AM]